MWCLLFTLYVIMHSHMHREIVTKVRDRLRCASYILTLLLWPTKIVSFHPIEPPSGTEPSLY